MGCSIINEKIQLLLSETHTSFNMMIDAGGHPNMDYAAFAAQASIHNFRSALQNPELSRKQLASLLRRASRKRPSIKQRRKKEANYWADFMADYIQENANNNETYA